MSLITCQHLYFCIFDTWTSLVFLDFVDTPVTMQLLHLFFMCCILTDRAQCFAALSVAFAVKTVCDVCTDISLHAVNYYSTLKILC